jgi:exonuclease III
MLEEAPTCITREGCGDNRHLVAKYSSAIKRDKALAEMCVVCKELSWRAVPARAWQSRQQHREPRSVEVENRNPFLALQDYQGTPRTEGVKGAQAAQKRKDLPGREKKLAKAPTIRRPALHLGSLNIRGKFEDKAHELEVHFKARKLDIVALQETRLHADKEVQMKGFKLLQPAKNDVQSDPSQGGGVAFLVALHLAAHCELLAQTASNQVWLRIGAGAGQAPLFVCNAYMPQATAGAESRREAWDNLSSDVTQHQRSGEVVVLGDLNARVSASLNGGHRVGAHLDALHNANGDELIQLLNGGSLVSLNGQKPPSKGDYWYTRQGPSGIKTMLDYVLVGDNLAAKSSFGVDYTDLDSDHYLIWATVEAPFQPILRRNQKAKRRFQLEKLVTNQADPEAAANAKSTYWKQLETKFAHWEPGSAPAQEGKSSCDLAVCDFVQLLHKALEDSVGSKSVSKRFTRGFYDKEVKESIAKRRSAHRIFTGTTAGSAEAAEAWNSYTLCRAESRKLVQHKKQQEFKRFVARIVAADRAGNAKLSWALLGRMKSTKASKAGATPVRRPDGTLATSIQDRLEAWALYQHQLDAPTEDPQFDGEFAAQVAKEVSIATQEGEGQCRQNPTAGFMFCKCLRCCELPPPGPQNLNADFTREEVEHAIQKLQNGKACGEDQLRNEMFKLGGGTMVTLLLKLFKYINDQGAVADDCRKATVVNLFKDGDPLDPSNYRGISLISCLGKLFLSIWAERITNHMENKLSDEQGGFRPHRSTIDQAFTLHEVLLRRRLEGKATFMYFVDFKKAFDTVWHHGLWKRLLDEGVNGRALQILQSLYSGIRQCVLVDGETTRHVPSYQGVRQGCPASPSLFNIFIDELVKELKKLQLGINVDSESLTALLYADDAALLADSAEDLQKLITAVDVYCRKWRMSLNLRKSEAMVIPMQVSNKSPSQVVEAMAIKLQVRGELVPLVSKFKYLGIWIQQDLGWDTHVAHNVAKAKNLHAVVSRALSAGCLPKAIKLMVWEAVVRARLEYGAEIVRLASKHVQILGAVQQLGTCTILRTRHAAKVCLKAYSRWSRGAMPRG